MMSRAELVCVGLMALILALFPEACTAKKGGKLCAPSSCGNINNITYPFRLKTDPSKCGDPRHELACENNRTILYICSGKYYVQEISFVNQTMRLIDASLDKDSCSLSHSLTYSSCSSPLGVNQTTRLVGASLDKDSCSLPLHSLTYFNCLSPFGLGSSNLILFMNCTKPMHNSTRYIDATPCTNNVNSSFPKKTYFYAVVENLAASDVPELCTIQSIVPALHFNIANLSIFYIHQQLLKGFDLNWYVVYHGEKTTFGTRLLNVLVYFLYPLYPIIRYPFFFSRLIGGLFIGRTLLGLLCFIAFLIYKFRRRHLSIDDTIEEFLQSHNNLMPIRYSYSEIKDITKGFKDKLGQGGYGSVYKGKLRSGHLVAVKVLGTSKTNGQDFINEVATIGRIYHVHVVRLIGFCVEGSKRAIIYEYMVNGSLDKFVFHKGEKINPLSWKRMYEIALGVGQGIEYLHQGCAMQILHFDIKPHNILLDENFIPKISDFGLAKLYSVDDSIVSLTAARGTLGYIAPELFYKNIGGVSHKADVYSFGMLLMEMVGKRKKVDSAREHSDQILYFPSWLYDRINHGEDIELGDVNEDEKKIAMKMMIVALWCTQMKPVDRPSMSKVLEMLEGEIEVLQMPPKPLLYYQEISVVDPTNNSPREAPILSYNDIGTITLDVR